jgi:hypothetical protein
MRGETMFEPPLKEYHSEERRTCSEWVYHIPVQSMKLGEMPLSMTPSMKRLMRMPA